MTIFGNIVTAPQVEGAVLATLRLWLPTYLSEVERQSQLEEGTMARPRSWTSSIEQDNFPGEQLPQIVVVSLGVDDTPDRLAAGEYSGWWRVSVASVVQANSEAAARTLAGRYAAAVRAAVIQHQSLGGVASTVIWRGEQYEGAAPGERNRSQAAGVVQFDVRVDDVVTERAGPAGPPSVDDLSPYPDWPEVEDVVVTVEKDPIPGA